MKRMPLLSPCAVVVARAHEVADGVAEEVAAEVTRKRARIMMVLAMVRAAEKGSTNGGPGLASQLLKLRLQSGLIVQLRLCVRLIA